MATSELMPGHNIHMHESFLTTIFSWYTWQNLWAFLAELHFASRTKLNLWHHSISLFRYLLNKLLLRNGDHAAYFGGIRHNGPLATETGIKYGLILRNEKYLKITSRRSTLKSKLVWSSAKDAMCHFMALSKCHIWLFSSSRRTSCPTSVWTLSVTSLLVLLFKVLHVSMFFRSMFYGLTTLI